MQRVTGVGGIFFNSPQPIVLRAWYKTHLGIDVQAWGGTSFAWANADGTQTAGSTIWTVNDAASNAFAPSPAPFMVNYRVADLDALVVLLKSEGCTVVENPDGSEYGKFAWVMDPDGNKVELWEPAAGE